MGTESHNTSNFTKCTLITPNPLDPLVVCLKSTILHGSVGICVSNARNGQFMHRLIPRRRSSARCDRKLHVWCFSFRSGSSKWFSIDFHYSVWARSQSQELFWPRNSAFSKRIDFGTHKYDQKNRGKVWLSASFRGLKRVTLKIDWGRNNFSKVYLKFTIHNEIDWFGSNVTVVDFFLLQTRILVILCSLFIHFAFLSNQKWARSTGTCPYDPYTFYHLAKIRTIYLTLT